VYGERFQRLDGRLWRNADDRGAEWTVTFDLGTADASAGQIGLFVWGHPAFPGPESLGA
jgi:hypothetical protein